MMFWCGGPIVSHLIQKLETEKENISFARVEDADSMDKLIKKDEDIPSVLSEDEIFEDMVEGVLNKEIFCSI